MNIKKPIATINAKEKRLGVEYSTVPPKKRVAKMGFRSKTKKSIACKLVLQMMDRDISYQKAVGIVTRADKRISKAKLEKELDKYV